MICWHAAILRPTQKKNYQRNYETVAEMKRKFSIFYEEASESSQETSTQ
jgi:hypothetical protein